MDLVDIDKVLDELEFNEDKVSQQPQYANLENAIGHSSGNGGSNTQRLLELQKQQTSRKIKVSSVFSSLNDYVDYDKNQKPSTGGDSEISESTSIHKEIPKNESNEEPKIVEHLENSKDLSIREVPNTKAITAETSNNNTEIQQTTITSQISNGGFTDGIEKKLIQEDKSDKKSAEDITEKSESTSIQEKPIEAHEKQEKEKIEPLENLENTNTVPVVKQENEKYKEEETISSKEENTISLKEEKQEPMKNNTNNIPIKEDTILKIKSVIIEDTERKSEDKLPEILEKSPNPAKSEIIDKPKDITKENPDLDDKKESSNIVSTINLQDTFSEQELESYLDDLENEFNNNQGSLPEIASNLSSTLKQNSNSLEKSDDTENIPSNKRDEEKEQTEIEGEKNISEDGEKETENVIQDDEEIERQQLLMLEKELQEEDEKQQMELDLQMALELANEENCAENQEVLSDQASNFVDNSSTQNANDLGEAKSDNENVEFEANSIRVDHGVDENEYRMLMNMGKSAPYWVPDSTHENCMQCEQKFSLIKRRHHCRCCGELLCSSCCSYRGQLDYIKNQQFIAGNSNVPFPSAPSVSSPNSSPSATWPRSNEVRICKKCDSLLKKRDHILIGRSIVVEGNDSGAEFQIKGVLKKPRPQKKRSTEDEDEDTGTDEASESVTTPTKNVIFSDGIRPGHDLDDDYHENKNTRITTKRIKQQMAPKPTIPEGKHVQEFLNNLKTHFNEKTHSFLPSQKTILPPIITNCDEKVPIITVKNDFQTCLDLCDFLKAEKRNFLIQKRFYCSVKIVNLNCCINRWCLNMTTNGLHFLGQKELIILIGINDEYFVNGTPNEKRNLNFLLLLMRRIFLHFNKIFSRISNEIRLEKEHIAERKKMELGMSPHSEIALFRHDNHIVFTPFNYFNSVYAPTYNKENRRQKPIPTEGDIIDSDESNYEEFLTDKYPFLKRPANGFIQNMDLTKITFGIRGDTDFFLDFSAILYVESNYQCLENLVLPDHSSKSCGDKSFLFGLLVKKTEIPWAKLFPLRLMMRFGAEYHLYPWPLFNALDRKCVFTEVVDNTIIHFLADFQNYTFTLNEIRGLYMYMEHEKDVDKKNTEMISIKILLPKLNFKRIETMINSSSESILAFFGNFNYNADGHLVCMQVPEDKTASKSSSCVYSTQSLNIDSKLDKDLVKTGINFFILNGALKTSTGLQAKVNIIEDGVMIQVLPQIMQRVRNNLLEMKDSVINCGENDDEKIKKNKTPVKPDPVESDNTNASESKEEEKLNEVVEFKWVDNDFDYSSGVKSMIDLKPLDKCSNVKIQCDLYRSSDKLNSKKAAQPPKKPLFSFAPATSGQKEADVECYYLHFQDIYLIDEQNYFYLFNGKMLNRSDEDSGESGKLIDNANLIKFLNVSNWEVSSINFIIKLATVLARTVHKALSKSYSQMYSEDCRKFAVRFKFETDQLVSYEAGSYGSKLGTSYMNDLDMELIPMLHALLQLQPKSTSNSTNIEDSRSVKLIGNHLNAELMDKLHLLQNTRQTIAFELVFHILMDL